MRVSIAGRTTGSGQWDHSTCGNPKMGSFSTFPGNLVSDRCNNDPVSAYPPPSPGLRVSDSQREAALASLRQALGDGRLATEEFDQRLSTALAARTHADLMPVMAGLLTPLPPWENPTTKERASAALTHLLGVVFFSLFPLVIVAVLRNSTSAFVRQHATEALDFQLCAFAIVLLTLGLASPIVFPISWLLFLVAAVRAMKGESFEYPLKLRHLQRVIVSVLRILANLPIVIFFD